MPARYPSGDPVPLSCLSKPGAPFLSFRRFLPVCYCKTSLGGVNRLCLEITLCFSPNLKNTVVFLSCVPPPPYYADLFFLFLPLLSLKSRLLIQSRRRVLFPENVAAILAIPCLLLHRFPQPFFEPPSFLVPSEQLQSGSWTIVLRFYIALLCPGGL